MSSTPTTKRGRGRPSNTTKLVNSSSDTVKLSTDDEIRTSAIHNDPKIFKTLFKYFQNIKANEIYLRFKADDIGFFSRNHQKTSRTYASMKTQDMYKYFCDTEVLISISCEYSNQVMANIDKTYQYIKFTLRHDDLDNLYVEFIDTEMSKTAEYKIPINKKDDMSEDSDLFRAEDDSASDVLKVLYPLEFTLPEDRFKKTVNDTSKISSVIQFSKSARDPFQISYSKNGLIYYEKYEDDAKIKLRYNSTESPFFIEMNIEYIKFLATTMVSGDVRILCREDGDMLFRSAVDESVLTVNTLVGIGGVH